MDYRQTVEWMFAKLPMYQRDGASAFRKDLTNTLLLAEHLGNPERSLTCIHIAGTNGKGSVSHMLASVLMESGYKTGLFTSPHLKDFRERIRIDGEMIPQENVVAFIDENRGFFDANDLSFFEMTTGLAFSYFAGRTDVCIIETGMGGRLDSTNIIAPVLSVITNIGLDHMQYLGATLERIAFEKAGIIKSGVPAVIGQYDHVTKGVFERTAKNVNAPLFFASDIEVQLPDSDLKGNYQRHNKKTVLKSLEVLRELGFLIPDHAIKQGLLRVTQNTHLRGRWEKLSDNPVTICDTAHNIDGLRETMMQLAAEKYETLHIVFGVVNDKDLSILEILPKNAIYYFCRPDIPRGLDAVKLRDESKKLGLIGKAYNSVAEAYDAARADAGSDDFIYIGGSTFVVAEIL